MKMRVKRVFSASAVWYLGALCIVVAGAGAGLFNPASSSATALPLAPEPLAVTGDTPTATHPLDEPLRLIADAKKAYGQINDYTCMMIKQERMAGQLSPVHVVGMMVRREPFSVYLKWQQPQANIGQEACYVAGRNGGKMRAKSQGVLGAVGFVTVDPNDPRARKSSNHPITEAGIGNLIQRFETRWKNEYAGNKTQSRIGDYEYNKRRCTRIETWRTEASQDVPYFRSVVYLDKETRLPIRVECYDWPKANGPAGGDLLEVYSYINMRSNVGLPDAVFNK